MQLAHIRMQDYTPLYISKYCIEYFLIQHFQELLQYCVEFNLKK
jgi:hypothetical protein